MMMNVTAAIFTTAGLAYLNCDVLLLKMGSALSTGLFREEPADRQYSSAAQWYVNILFFRRLPCYLHECASMLLVGWG